MKRKTYDVIVKRIPSNDSKPIERNGIKYKANTAHVLGLSIMRDMMEPLEICNLISSSVERKVAFDKYSDIVLKIVEYRSINAQYLITIKLRPEA